jgi:type II secretory pathway pseudopilin PulG
MRTTIQPTCRTRGVGGRARARGFTIVEATIVIGIIAVLAGIVLYAVGLVRKKGDTVAELATVTALQKAVEQFKQQFGFLPSLVLDGPTSPINAMDQIQVWSIQDLADPNTTLNGSTPGNRRCWSVLSLPYYLLGALDAKYDGGAGLTFTAPTRDGQFSKHGRAYNAMVEFTQQKTRLGAPRLFISNNAVPNSTPLQRADCEIWDRWSGTGNSHSIRYYRWLPAYYPQGDPKAGQVQYWNIPVEIGGNPVNTLPPLKAELRTAEYAVVSAGPDGLFGDEAILTTAAARAKAMEDNIMEVGR